MKKTYIKPQIEIFELCTEAVMLDASKVSIDSDKSATQWSNKKSGWSSDDWTSGAEE
ncbi:MAG: hypothetical protein Q4E59_04920 [Bacteroidales bacterium]|nr:hypothetical protein [Bacteroidales bacterium]